MTFGVDDARAFAREVLRPAVFPERVGFDVSARSLPGEPVPAAEAVAGPFTPFAVGDRWGGMWGTTWFRLRAAPPERWAGRELVALIHLGGARTVGFSAEGLIHDVDLRVVQGLHHEHREYPLGTGAGPVEFWVEAAANPIPRWHMKDWPRLEPDYAGPPLYALEQADLAVVDRSVEALWLDFCVCLEVAQWMPDRRAEVMEALVEVSSLVSSGAAPGAGRAVLAAVLGRRGGPERLESARRHTAVAVGHAHIDTAWLWPLRETRRKCARTFANQLALLDRYPEHHFVCSQAVQYQWVKEDHPDLYERIRQRVADGRWEPVGGMWVEADSNVPSGESLVRQFVHGKRFFLEEFGRETAEMWIPDVFGYSAALPQIAAAAGVTALVTQKMSWNDTNEFPHSTFWWEGHDGSRVLAHFPPANTYNGNVSVPELLNDERNFKDVERSARTLYPFGFGDGGGGPTAQMLERAARLADVDGLPRLRVGTVAGFLDEVRAELRGGGGDLATWVGELYLEAHRATSTTHADVKWGNRRGEEVLRAAEMWSVAAGLDRRAELDRLWKLLLVNQFHDIIPGSSIAWVYRDAAADHAEVLAGAGAVIDESLSVLAGPVAGTDPGGLVVFNPSTWDRCEVADLPGGELAVVRVPGCGWAPVGDPAGDAGRSGAFPPVTIGDGWIDNGLLRVQWDADGLLVSVWDHEAGREVLAAGAQGNLFQLHEDHPKAFDAWDVDREYLDQVEDLTAATSVEVAERHPLRAGVRIVREFGPAGSRIDQVMRLAAGSRRLEFHTEVDWQERHRFLKVAFPVAVRSSRATFEIQHGHVERPTVANTSWDEARFEVSAHRWADLSEPGYGVALLNDCKYGYDVRGHTLRLSLLRGPGYPDPDADRGHHRFAYALLPHQGDLRFEGRVVEEAEAFNLPLVFRGAPGGGEAEGRGSGVGGVDRVVGVDRAGVDCLVGVDCVVGVDRAGVSVEAVKWADDGDGVGGDVVVRLCEVFGARGPVTVTPSWPVGAVHRCDLLERPAAAIPVDGGRVKLDLRPFELVTLRFSPA